MIPVFICALFLLCCLPTRTLAIGALCVMGFPKSIAGVERGLSCNISFSRRDRFISVTCYHMPPVL